MAVGGVGSELVSTANSLMCRENTGNSAEFGHHTDRFCQNLRANSGGWKGSPYGYEQGIGSSKQGIPGAEQGIETPCFPLTSELGELRHRRANS